MTNKKTFVKRKFNKKGMVAKPILPNPKTDVENSMTLTRHHALPVQPRADKHAVRAVLPPLNLIAAGKVIVVLTTQLFTLLFVSEFLI